MDNEEKKVKTTTPKKRNTTKKEDTKKTTKASATKNKPVKKVATKKTTTKTKATNKTTTRPKTVKKEEKIEVVDLPKEEVKIEDKETKVVTKSHAQSKKVSKEILEIRRKRYIIEAVIIAALVFVGLILLCNRTFLGVKYKTDNINISIPRFSYYVNDKDNKVKFVTLRKSKYLNDYYNEYLEGFIFYSCSEGENTFYYNEKTKSLIKEIKIEKHFAIKTIEVTYDTRSPEEVCGLR